MKTEEEFREFSELADTCLKAVALFAVASYVLAATVRFASCNEGLPLVFPTLFGMFGAFIVFYVAIRIVWLQLKLSDERNPEVGSYSKMEYIYTMGFLLLIGLGVTVVLVTQFAQSNSDIECLERSLIPGNIR